jgi:hypothetical protein
MTDQQEATQQHECPYDDTTDDLRACHDRLVTAAEIALVVFEKAMPSHMYRNGCFNWRTQPTDCHCTAHMIRKAVEGKPAPRTS